MSKLGFILGLTCGCFYWGFLRLKVGILQTIVEWVEIYLGSAVYFYIGTLVLFIWWIYSLRSKLRAGNMKVNEIASLNARINMLPNACITIGMIYTILGMASGIQNFVLAVADGVENPLKVLVEQGALIALMTTAFGLGGAWILRLSTERLVGSQLRQRQEKEEEWRQVRAIQPLMEIEKQMLSELKTQNLLFGRALSGLEKRS